MSVPNGILHKVPVSGLAPSAKTDVEISINTIKVQTKTTAFFLSIFIPPSIVI
jgi:hypothetical protein